MTAVDELAVYDVVDGVGAPVPRILCAAARPRSAAPFVGEQHLRPVIVERRRVPIGEAFVDHRVDPLRLARVGDVEDDAVARTRARGEIAGRKDGGSEEHTYELQSLMRDSYAVFCLNNKTDRITITSTHK